MLIHIILILCLQLMKFGEGKEVSNETAFYDRSWNWKNACEKHPLAIEAKAVENKNDLSIGKRCTLKFDYAVDEGDEARAEFCRAMFPDQLRSSNMEGSDKIACVYQRTYACSGNNKEFLIGSKCLKIAGIAMNLNDAKIVCEFGDFKLFSPADGNELLAFLSRLYSFDQTVPTVWTFDNQVAAQYYLKYSAIGNHRPGDTVLKTDAELGEEAMAVCVRKANAVEGAKQQYCDVLTNFFKLKTVDDGTCYMVTPSVMVGKKNKANNKLVTIDHFNTICKANHENLDFPVSPRSKEQAKALQAVKQGLLLPGSMNVDFDFTSIDVDQKSTEKSKEILSGKEQIASRFLYVTSRYVKKQINGKDGKVGYDTTIQSETAGVPVDQYWPNPIKEGELKVNPGILYWNKKGHMENVEQFRRAPIMCGSGRPVVASFECENGWELAHRGDKALCFRVIKRDCPTFEQAKQTCAEQSNPLGESFPAPVKSAEEETAIARAMSTTWGAELVNQYAVFVGGKAEEVGDWPFYWLWFEDGIEKKEIGKEDPNYKGWISGEPDYSRLCINRKTALGISFLWETYEGDCFREKCVALSFYNGKSTGLNDIVCEERCVSATIKSVACAKWAKPIVNSDA